MADMDLYDRPGREPIGRSGVVARVIVTRIKVRMTAMRTNASAVSRRAGLGATAVSDIISGKNASPSVHVLRPIAEALACDLAYLIGDQDHCRLQLRGVDAPSMPLVGIVEAGAFREQAGFETDFPMVFAPLSTQYPRARHFAMEVRGSSMNAARPTPIHDGMMVLCVDVEDAGLAVESGRIYVIRRTLDGGRTFELALKRAVISQDRIELRSESSDALNGTIMLSRTFEADEPARVEAIGWVYAAYTSLETR